MVYINGYWAMAWSIIGVSLTLAGKFIPRTKTPFTFAIAYSSIFSGLMFLLLQGYENGFGEDFLISVTTSLQPIIFFGLAFLSLSYVIALRYYYKRIFNSDTFNSQLVFVWLSLSIPEVFTKFSNLVGDIGFPLLFGYSGFFLLYNLGVVYFIEKSLPNSKLGMFAAVLKLIFEIWFVGVLGNRYDLTQVFPYLISLALLIQVLVFLHYKKIRDAEG
ncbi:MAG: hypothetical protein D6732_14630 [Methanobacteriota archaeon]|nr:MAG: hypothetical protein D6732_14630 [Euryarchaeota archaeon]